ncbi:ABC-2 transporter permease [Anaerosporobacter sp.]
MLRGLLLKDLLVLKKSILIGLAILIFYSVVGIYDASFISFYYLLFFSLLTISSHSFDEQARWTPYALTTTTNRTKLVQSKYLLALITAVGGFLCSILMTITQLVLKSGTFVLTISPVLWVALYIALLFNFIILPILFKLGSENSRAVIFAIFALPSIVVIIISKNNSLPSISKEMIDTIIKILPYIGVISISLFGILSYYISLKIVRKKDF